MGSKQQRNLHPLVIVSFLLTSSVAVDGQIRLAGSRSTRCSGRVEIYRYSLWGTVCDDDWDLNDAQVVCRQLGCGSALSTPHSAHYGEGSGPIWLDDVGCSGSESSVTECTHRSFGTLTCRHSEDAGVVCSDPEVRLAGSGSNRCSGRVEIYLYSTWGTVCDDKWDLNDAQVVCRQLGCGSALNAPPLAHYGQGTGPIWLDDVSCSGSERSVTECTHPGFGTNNCGHGEDAGVLCSDAGLEKPSMSMYPTAEVSWGQSVSITCSSSSLHQQLFSKTTFILEKTSSSFRESRTPGSSSASFSIQEVNLEHEGWYRCQYQIRVSGRAFSSPFSDSVRLSVSVPQQKPTLSLTSPSEGALGGSDGPEVTWGQSVSITCSASTLPEKLISKTTFILEKTSSSFRESRAPGSSSASFSIQEVNLEHEGWYRCQYQIRVSGRGFSSPFSDSVRLSVSVPQQKPTLSLMSPGGEVLLGPDGSEVTWGQSISITCSSSSLHQQLFSNTTFILENNSSSFRESRAPGSSSASFSIQEVNLEHEGWYRCQYQIRVSGRAFSSPFSDSVRLSVSVPQQKPTLSLMSPGREVLVGPDGPEVTWGQSVSISCSSSSLHQQLISNTTFILENNSSSFRESRTPGSSSASFSIQEVNLEHEGWYRCQYQIRVSGRNFSSPFSDSVRLSVSVPQQKPTLSLMSPGGEVLVGPDGSEVTWGQSISITCSSSSLHQQLFSNTTFILENNSSSFRESRTPGSSSASFSIQEVNLEHEGWYRCQYQIRVSGRGFSSPFSDSVRLSVSVPQQKPTLSVTSPGGEVLMGPDGPEVTWGQSVSISCSSSSLHQQLFSNTTFILEKTSSSFRESRTPGSSSASFSIQEVNLEHEGWYRCQYQIRVSGRGFSSPFSDSVRLSVSVPLLQPNLSLTSPSGGLFWSPEGVEVTRGHSFLLTCSIAPQYPGGLFSLLFSGSRLNVSRPAVNHSASFSFPAAGPEQQGNYSCLYEVTLSSRTFTSTQEASLTVIITFPVMVLVASVCGGALLLVLLVLGGVFFFFLIRRRRPADLNQTPMFLGAMKFNKEENKQNIYVTFGGEKESNFDITNVNT